MRAISLVLFTACAWAQPVSYVIGSANGATLHLEVQKTGLLSGKRHDFRFDAVQGTVKYDAAKPEVSIVDLKVEASKFTLLDTWVSEGDRTKISELTRGKEMLAADRFPLLTFRSVTIAAAGAGRFRVSGTLTIRGRSEAVDVNVFIKEAGGALLAEGDARVRMTKLGLKPPSTAFGAIGTRDEMLVRFVLPMRIAQ